MSAESQQYPHVCFMHKTALEPLYSSTKMYDPYLSLKGILAPQSHQKISRTSYDAPTRYAGAKNEAQGARGGNIQYPSQP